MTPRERVLTALEHREPDRVPFAWGFGCTAEMHEALRDEWAEWGIDWDMIRDRVSDIVNCAPAYHGPALPPGRDIWGIGRTPTSYGAGSYAELSHLPLAGVERVEDLEHYPWPDPTAWDDAALAQALWRARSIGFNATRVPGGNPFEIYCWMTGLEEALTNLVLRPELVVAALEPITRYFEQRLECMLGGCGEWVDLVFLADDLGGQHGPLIAPRTYREVLQPFHRRLVQAVRVLAPHAKVMFHTDGSVFDLLDDLVETGIDVLEAVQVDAANMEPERLKAAYGDQLCFHGAISVQQLLPHATRHEVYDEVLRLQQVLGAGGGYIAAPSHAIQVGTPPDNVTAMLYAAVGDDDMETLVHDARLPRHRRDKRR